MVDPRRPGARTRSAAAPRSGGPDPATAGRTAPGAGADAHGLPCCRCCARTAGSARATGRGPARPARLRCRSCPATHRRPRGAAPRWPARRCAPGHPASVKPRYSMSRLHPQSRRRHGRSTTNGNIGAICDSTSSGMSSMITASGRRRRSISSERRCATSGCTMPFRVLRFSSSLNAIGGQRGPVQRTVRQQDVRRRTRRPAWPAPRCRVRRPRGRSRRRRRRCRRAH